MISNEQLIFLTSNIIEDFKDFSRKIKKFGKNHTYQKFEISNRHNVLSKELLDTKYTLIIDGKTMSYFDLLNESDKVIFLTLLSSSSSAICCRLAPKQKANLVKIVKKYINKITLSVGDGSNDVPMIMEANIGIGISGKEGTQVNILLIEAVRAADYSIGKFHFVKDLLLVHGRLGYRKISFYICYSFYKNIVVVLTEIYFIAFNFMIYL